MPEPKKRMSVTRSKRRRSRSKSAPLTMSTCARCKKPVARHRIHVECLDTTQVTPKATKAKETPKKK